MAGDPVSSPSANSPSATGAGAIDASIPRAVLVTGAARRIGRTIARALAADGWAVAAHYHRSRAEADSLIAEIEAGGGQAVALAADLADEAATQELVPRAGAALGRIGALINNAAIFENDTVAGASQASWEAHMAINLRAPFVLTQAFARQLPTGAHGAVVNLVDQRVWRPGPEFVSYTLSKSGLWTLTRTLALALAPNIRVNAIGPGPTLANRRQSAAEFARQASTTPLARATTPEEIAEAVRFLLAAGAMTGQMIALDGGQHLRWAQPSQAGEPRD